MGFIITPKCNCISEAESYYIGLGLKDYDKSYQNELAFCDSCKRLDVVGESNACTCGARLRKIYTIEMLNQNVTTIECPGCGGAMQIEVTGMWD